jgi:hypothetical protein
MPGSVSSSAIERKIPTGRAGVRQRERKEKRKKRKDPGPGVFSLFSFLLFLPARALTKVQVEAYGCVKQRFRRISTDASVSSYV